MSKKAITWFLPAFNTRTPLFPESCGAVTGCAVLRSRGTLHGAPALPVATGVIRVLSQTGRTMYHTAAVKQLLRPDGVRMRLGSHSRLATCWPVRCDVTH